MNFLGGGGGGFMVKIHVHVYNLATIYGSVQWKGGRQREGKRKSHDCRIFIKFLPFYNIT